MFLDMSQRTVHLEYLDLICAISHGPKYSSTDVHISLEQTEMTRAAFNGRRLGDANGAG